MRLASIFLAGALAVFASAQSVTSKTTAAPTTTDAATAAQNSAQAAMMKCIEACRPGDVNCTSHCITVPSPNASQVNATNQCVGACPKGTGTAADIASYKSCVEGCIAAHYYTSSVGTPQATGGSGSSNNNNNGGGGGSSSSGSGSGGGASATQSGSGPTGTSGFQASGTSGGAAASSSKAAAGTFRVQGAAAGLFGFMAALLAL